MNIFVETTLNDFFISLFKDEKIIDYILVENLEKKSDYLPEAFEKILAKNNLTINDINGLYLTKGPGSFMGIRASLIYLSTIAKIKSIPLFLKDSLFFFGKGEDFYFDAKGGLSYKWDKKENKSILVDFKENSTINWNDIISNFNLYLNNFEKVNPTLVECNYVKEPKIG